MNTNDSFNQTKTVTARIVSVHKNRFQIALDSAERKAAEHDAVLAGRLLYRGEIPVVGDYIEAEVETSPVGKPVGDARIVSILPRKSLITRPEYRVGTQNMAANVDICFLVVSANADFSVNRIARYASAVLQGGSKPVVVLTKADLCSDLSEHMHRINEICGNIQMHCVSSKTGVGIDELRQYLVPGTTIGLFGSSGVGKSTLMKLLSKSDVFAENKLFATLDTTVRKVIIDNLPFLLTDTIGFIRKLPTHLVDSFKSTLDEVRDADILVHVVDISHPQFEEQIEVVNRTLQEVCESKDKPMILVFNKVDAFTYVKKDDDDLTPRLRENIPLEELKQTWMAKMNDNCIFISARERINIDELKSRLYEMAKEIHMKRFPYNDFLFQKYDEEDLMQ